MTPAIIRLESCASTSTALAAMPDAPAGTVVATREQTAGRGQRGNSWEAEPGANLTFSMLIRPAALEASRQFELSMLVSLAIADAIDRALAGRAHTQIKWPNDIYVGREKICGILIENTLAGRRIERSIAGIGINVNQRAFVSDAPNPTSVIHHNGGTLTDLDAMLADVCAAICREVDSYEADPDPAALKARYMERLIWTSGNHSFTDADGTFTAHITDVGADGILTLSNSRHYAFKEVVFNIF